MENEEELDKTQIQEFATDIALQAEITPEKAIEVIIKLLYYGLQSKQNETWMVNDEFFIVNKGIKQHPTEIAFIRYNDEYNVIYNVNEDKYYYEYGDGDGVRLEEVEI